MEISENSLNDGLKTFKLKKTSEFLLMWSNYQMPLWAGCLKNTVKPCHPKLEHMNDDAFKITNIIWSETRLSTVWLRDVSLNNLIWLSWFVACRVIHLFSLIIDFNALFNPKNFTPLWWISLFIGLFQQALSLYQALGSWLINLRRSSLFFSPWNEE